MEINWQKNKLTVTFTYPYVHHRCIDEKKNKWNSSNDIIQRAIDKWLKKTHIRWTNGSGGRVSTLKLEIWTNEKISLEKASKLLHGINEQIEDEIYKLINYDENIKFKQDEKIR